MNDRYRAVFEQIKPTQEQTDRIRENLVAAARGAQPTQLSLHGHRRVGRAVAAVLAAVILLTTAVFAGELTGLFDGFLTQRTPAAEYVRENVFEDDDEHIKVQVLELLSDEVTVHMIVRYEAMDEAYLDQIEDLNWEDLYIFPFGDSCNLSYGCIPLEDYSEDNARYYYVTTDNTNWNTSLSRGEFTYRLSDGEHTVVLDTSCNVPVYEYELQAEEGETLSQYYEPTYVRLSCLSYVIYGKNQGLFAENRSSILLRDEDYKRESIDTVCFLREDGTEICPEWSAACGELAGPLGSTMGKYDCLVASGSFLEFCSDISIHTEEVDPTELTGLRLSNGNGTVYYSIIKPYTKLSGGG